jgi:hypothetical protein
VYLIAYSLIANAEYCLYRQYQSKVVILFLMKCFILFYFIYFVLFCFVLFCFIIQMISLTEISSLGPVKISSINPVILLRKKGEYVFLLSFKCVLLHQTISDVYQLCWCRCSGRPLVMVELLHRMND